MKRAALLIAAVLVVAVLAIVVTRPTSSTSPTSSTTAVPGTTAAPGTLGTAAPRPAPRISRREVMAQHDQVTATERGRIGRTRLMDTTLVTAAEAHGVTVLSGPARTRDRDPQQMVVTPEPALTVREIASAVSLICAALEDPCLARDYRFVIQTPSGRALLPARLIDPKKD